MRYLNDLDLKNKKLLIRVDFNVPLDKNQNITDDTRIRGVLPTINYALDQKTVVILCSHLGRPKGKPVPEMSLAPVARRLGRLLQKEVTMAPDCIGPEVKKMIEVLKPGDILLLENLRFHSEEEKNDETFAGALAEVCDIYINDAFAVSHRAHASVEAVTRFAKVCAAGFLLKDEIKFFHQSMEDPARPLAAIIGGSKVSSKLGALENLLKHVNKMIIGGAMANTFLKSLGYEVGKSLVEEDLVLKAGELMEKARELGVKFYLPVDCVAGSALEAQAENITTTVQEVPKDWMILDIGPATSLLFSEALVNAKTIIWNGPMGAFEIDPFSHGTMEMVRTVAGSRALTIVGGGDTDVAVHKAGESSNISYISTGGGAFLELLEGKKLPGIAALENC
ncbi:MAG: phosphoglycerate kinase [Thermodesulfobacteriota bacterium]